MKSRILHSSYVINFLDVDFSSDEISRIIKLEVDEILKDIKIDCLSKWEVEFRITYGKKPKVRVYKKMPSYVKNKQKLITIHVPIPTKDAVPWGVDANQHIDVATHPNEMKSVSFFEVSVADFASRTEYILACVQRAVALCFKEGFTVNGIKVISK